MTTATNPPLALLLADDFLWMSKVMGAGQAAGWRVRSLNTLPRLVEFAKQEAPRLVIIDLGVPSMNAADVVASVKAVCTRSPRFVAYGSHVDTATLQAARDAGCDPVLPRSKMSTDLHTLMHEWLKSTT
jgi:DNA-binding NarL/FixJ family response regulator